ncbi:MAG: multidrug ABC transporter permease, partial [Rhodospirillales bacterium]
MTETPLEARPRPVFSDRISLWTLYSREVRRFMKIHTQTLLAPVVTTLLFLAVFA